MIWQHIFFGTIYCFWGEILPLGDPKKKEGAYNHYKRFYEKKSRKFATCLGKKY